MVESLKNRKIQVFSLSDTLGMQVKVIYPDRLLNDKKLRRFHYRIAADYEAHSDSMLSKWCRTPGYCNPWDIAEAITKSGLFLDKNSTQQRDIIVSLSANIGINEHYLQLALGDKYLMVSSDLADVERVTDDNIRADADFLPFVDESIFAFIDRDGAVMAETKIDRRLKNIDGANTRRLFERMRKKLKPNGMVIIDDKITVPNISTGVCMDRTLLSPEIEGYKTPFVIGSDIHTFRVYRKK